MQLPFCVVWFVFDLCCSEVKHLAIKMFTRTIKKYNDKRENNPFNTQSLHLGRAFITFAYQRKCRCYISYLETIFKEFTASQQQYFPIRIRMRLRANPEPAINEVKYGELEKRCQGDHLNVKGNKQLLK